MYRYCFVLKSGLKLTGNNTGVKLPARIRILGICILGISPGGSGQRRVSGASESPSHTPALPPVPRTARPSEVATEGPVEGVDIAGREVGRRTVTGRGVASAGGGRRSAALAGVPRPLSGACDSPSALPAAASLYLGTCPPPQSRHLREGRLDTTPHRPAGCVITSFGSSANGGMEAAGSGGLEASAIPSVPVLACSGWERTGSPGAAPATEATGPPDMSGKPRLPYREVWLPTELQAITPPPCGLPSQGDHVWSRWWSLLPAALSGSRLSSASPGFHHPLRNRTTAQPGPQSALPALRGLMDEPRRRPCPMCDSPAALNDRETKAIEAKQR